MIITAGALGGLDVFSGVADHFDGVLNGGGGVDDLEEQQPNLARADFRGVAGAKRKCGPSVVSARIKSSSRSWKFSIASLRITHTYPYEQPIMPFTPRGGRGGGGDRGGRGGARGGRGGFGDRGGRGGGRGAHTARAQDFVGKY